MERVTKDDRRLLAMFGDDATLDARVLTNGTLRASADRLERLGLVKNDWPEPVYYLTQAGKDALLWLPPTEA